MKKILALVLITALMGIMAIPVMADAAMTAPKITMTLDGVRDDGYGGPYDIKAFKADEGATGQVWTAWDDSYVYYYIEITDTTPNHEHANDYECDCVEMFFDWYNTKDDDTSDASHPYWQYRTASKADENGRQFTNGINQAAGEDGTGWSVEAHVASQTANNVVKPLKGGDLNGGYIVETRIAYKEFGVNLSEGSVIGVDFQIGDNQTGEGRTAQIFIGTEYQSEDQWQYPNSVGGSLTLGAAPAAPAAPEPEPEPAAGGGSEAPDQPVVTAPAPTAPKTGDSALVFAGLLVAAAGALVITKRAGKSKA